MMNDKIFLMKRAIRTILKQANNHLNLYDVNGCGWLQFVLNMQRGMYAILADSRVCFYLEVKVH